MSTRELQTALASLEFSRTMLLAFLNGTPEPLWFHIPIPDGNHAAWIAGHVAWEDDDCLNALVEGRATRVPKSWHERFATGAKPTPQAADYPSIADLRAKLDETRRDFIAYFETIADELDKPIPNSLHGFAKDRAALMHAVAAHEMIHVGQLTVIRKSLKLSPVFA